MACSDTQEAQRNAVLPAALCLWQDKRQVTWHEGMEFAKLHGCLFVETSAKSGVAVTTAFEELVLKVGTLFE